MVLFSEVARCRCAPTADRTFMPKLWPFSKSEEIKAEAFYENSTIPIGYGKEYFEDNSFNVKEFANEAMNSDSIVYACLRELGTAAAEPSYRVLLPTSDQPIQAPDTNPISRLLERPNENQDFYQFIDELVINLYVAGNAYLYKTRNGGGKVVGMRLLRPDRVSIKVLSSDGSLAYQYELDGVRYRLNPEDVSQLKFPSMTSDLYGLSPLQPIASVINLSSNPIRKVLFPKQWYAIWTAESKATITNSRGCGTYPIEMAIYLRWRQYAQARCP